MENYLMHGETDSDDAARDNETIDNLESTIDGELEDILDCGDDAEDFKVSYNDIQEALGNASFDYTFYDFSLYDDLSEALDDLSAYYYWKKHSYEMDKYQTQENNEAFPKDMKVIKDYVDDYKESHGEPGCFLDL